MASVYKRGNVYWGRAQRDGKLLRRSLRTSSRELAKRRLRAWLDELDSIMWGEKPRRLYKDASERFIREHLPTLKLASARRYGSSLKNLGPHFKDLYLDQITSASLSDFESARRMEGVSPPTIRRDLACLSSIFGCCEIWEWADVNPVPVYMRRRRRMGLKEADPRTRYLTHDEEHALLNQTDGMLRNAIMFAIDTGFRKEEQFSLTWDQVDLNTREVRTTTDTKSGKWRKVPLLPRTAQMLAQLPRFIDRDYVFYRPNGERIKCWNKKLKTAAKAAKLKDLRWHDLRRTCGCRLLQDHGKEMSRVALWLGHHSVTVTEKHYAFLEFDSLHSDSTKMGTASEDSRRKSLKDKGND